MTTQTKPETPERKVSKPTKTALDAARAAHQTAVEALEAAHKQGGTAHGDAARAELEARATLRELEANVAGAGAQKASDTIQRLESQLEAARQELESAKRRREQLEAEAVNIRTQLGEAVRVYRGTLPELEALAGDCHTVIDADALAALVAGWAKPRNTPTAHGTVWALVRDAAVFINAATGEILDDDVLRCANPTGGFLPGVGPVTCPGFRWNGHRNTKLEFLSNQVRQSQKTAA